MNDEMKAAIERAIHRVVSDVEHIKQGGAVTITVLPEPEVDQTRHVWLAGNEWREVAKTPMHLGGKMLGVPFARPDGLVITVYEMERSECHG